MNKLEEIFLKCAKEPVQKEVLGETYDLRPWRVVAITMNSEQFKSAIREVLEEVLVSDGEIEDMLIETSKGENCWFDIEYFAAMNTRDLSKQKLENLLR